MVYEKEILDAAVRISEARFRNECIAINRVHRGRILELEERVDNLIGALKSADEYIEELEDSVENAKVTKRVIYVGELK